MQFHIFSVFDEKAEAFLPPFFLPTVGMAVRSFSECVNDREHMFGKHPSDYTLFELGSFDDSSGCITADVKRTVHNGVELLSGDAVDQTALPLKGVG